MRIWDELIQNRDRNQGNILWTHDWTLWLIDHTRAFRLNTICSSRSSCRAAIAVSSNVCAP